MPKNFFSGETLMELGKSATKAVGDQVKSTSAAQVGGDTAIAALDSSGNQDLSTNDFISDLYGASQTTSTQSQINAQQQTASDQQKLDLARQQLQKKLHNEVYYDPLFAYEQKKQETIAERLEKERQEEEAEKMEELQQEEKKKAPVTPGAAKGERQPGASG